MSKTAEEILNEHFAKSVPTNTPMWDSAINAANEFAAQEVEAYREKLKVALYDHFQSYNESLKGMASELIKLIDAVK